LLAAYKVDPRFKQLTMDAATDFLGFKHSRTPSYLEIDGNTQWSLQKTGSITDPVNNIFYQSYFGVRDLLASIRSFVLET
jgi:hypothetical protein